MRLPLSLRAKLFISFGILLGPVLILLLLDFRESREARVKSEVEAHLETAQALAVQIDELLDGGLGIGRAVANDDLVRSMDPARLDPHLRRLVEKVPAYDTINVFDATGLNRGWGHLTEPAEPRLTIGDRPYFRQTMATGTPTISNVLSLRRPLNVGIVLAVPIMDDAGKPMGVVNVVTRADILAKRYAFASLDPGQAIMLVDPHGRLAFHSLVPEISFEASNAYVDFAPFREALAGHPSQASEFVSPLTHDIRIGAFVRTPKHHWAVGITTPRVLALAPLRKVLRARLLAYAALLCLSGFLLSVLVRLVSAPVNKLSEHARALGRGDLTRRVQIRSGDELEELGQTFNEMAARLEERQAELQRAQVELVRRERLTALGELAAIVAHEVRNPLAVIFNAVHALRKRETSRDAEELVTMLYEEADRLNQIVGDFLNFARPPELSLRPADLGQVIEEVVAAASGNVGPVRIECEISPDLPQVYMDARLVRQAMVNLVANALQAMTRGGTIRVRARRATHDGRAVAQVEVSDEGIGMNDEVRARIFEPFFTTKAAGTGLGLAVVKRIIEDHHGCIEVQSELGKGTTFVVQLPVDQPFDS